VNLGYGRKELVEAARAQLETLPYYNSFFQCTHPPAIELTKMLMESRPVKLKQVFYTGSGSRRSIPSCGSCVTTGRCRASRQEHHHLARERLSRQHRRRGERGRHGTDALAGRTADPGIVHIEQPVSLQERRGHVAREYGRKAAQALAAKIEWLGVDNVAAFIAEPIQGAGGVIIPPRLLAGGEEGPRALRHPVRRDEVICGFGRTGEWWGTTYYGLEPDLITFAKAVTSGYLPLGGVFVGERVAEALVEKGGEFYHGFTYSAHPASCAVAIENLRLLRDEGHIERVKNDTGPVSAEALARAGDHPLVGEVRGLGFLGALELVKDKRTRELFDPVGTVGTIARDISVEQGLVMRAVRDGLIIAPPLTMTRAQIDELVETAGRTLDLTAKAIA
jgi:putrescine aminotransferase